MFKQLRQHLKKTFQQPLETSAQSSFSEGGDKNVSVARGQTRVETRTQLTDAEYEILFIELLAGVNNGWTRENAEGFLAAKRVVEADLLVWLRASRERLLELNILNDELATRMVRLGELGIGQLGEVARKIGIQLLRQNESEPIPEYEKDTEDVVTAKNLNGAQSSYEAQATPELDKLWELLGKKPSYTQQVSFNLRVQTNQQVETTQVNQVNYAYQSDKDLAEVLFEEGVEHYQAGNLEAALVCFNQAVKIKSDYHQAWYNLGTALLNLERFEQAVVSFNQAVEIKPDYHEAWYNLGTVFWNSGRFEQAVASYNQAIEIKPDSHEAWNNLGAALSDLRRFEQAVASYNQAVQIKPDYHEAWNNLGNALSDLGRFEQAVASYNQAVQIKPDKYKAWHSLGNTLFKLGRIEQAVASYNQAVTIKPDYYEAWNHLGNALGNLRRFEEAVASFNQAVTIKPDFHPAWKQLGKAFCDLGRFEEAVASYNQAVTIKPDYYDAWNNLGIALCYLGRFEEAVASYNQAVTIKPDYYDAWNELGNAFCDLGRFEKAVAPYNQAVTIKPDYYDAWNNLGIALCYLGRFEEAVASYNQAVTIKADLHQARSNLGAALSHLERLEEAVTSFNQAVEIKPDYHEAWHGRGVAARYSVSCNSLWMSSIARKNPDLNQRGYEGELASYQEGLKYCQQETHPEGWGILHQAIGKAHFYRGHGDINPRPYWYEALKSYNEALKTLTQEDFPEAHLDVLQDLIRVRLDLGDIGKAGEIERIATDLLRRLLNECKSPAKKQQLALKFAGFQQLTVDLAVQSGDLARALEVAEQGKNTCLSWLFDGDSNEIYSPTWQEIKQLLNPTTAIVYWHLSPAALHTFILKHGASLPLILGETQLLENTKFFSQAERLYRFEAWVKKWNEQYANHKDKDKPEEAESEWKKNLPELLLQLGAILNISTIIEKIQNSTSPIYNLILIPHRDLHRFPLHALFPDNFTVTYLPGAKIGIALEQQANNSLPSFLLSVEAPNSKKEDGEPFEKLLHAEIESATICQMFENPQRISSNKATKESVIAALKSRYNIFHFTGHGTYNFQNPKNQLWL